jgi:hypothetical protein
MSVHSLRGGDIHVEPTPDLLADSIIDLAEQIRAGAIITERVMLVYVDATGVHVRCRGKPELNSSAVGVLEFAKHKIILDHTR